VIDLGCGKGDILLRLFDAGAKVLGIDNDGDNILHIQRAKSEFVQDMFNINGLMWCDIDQLIMEQSIKLDVAICFSVLPYLKRPIDALKWINQHSDVALIECQYAGDGPGFDFLSGNDDMRNWLLQIGEFKEVEPIGHTLVEGRNTKRFIWRCE